jgi:lysozyme family protein
MADFAKAFERMLLNEGGYRLTDIKGDKGGQTYAGIARNRWPNWSGWRVIDRGEKPSAESVRDFYSDNFWHPVWGSEIASQRIAENLFDFAVNAGPGVSVKLAQIVVGATPDGKFGPKTLAGINSADEQGFVLAYALAKIARYRDIVTKDRSQAKFLLGWINRTLKEAA